MLIEADTHCHSIASTHAYSTIDELAKAAKAAGLKLFALTDHGPASPDSPHVWHFHNYKVLPREICGIPMLRGVEADIVDLEGNLDMTPVDLRYVEWVVASFHTSVIHGYTAADYTKAYQKLAKEQAVVDVIGHCSTVSFPFDYAETLKCFREYEKLVELNESSMQYKKGAKENAFEILRLCKQYEVPIIVNTDSHYATQLGQTPICEEMLAALEFPRKLIFNADADRVCEFVARKRNIIVTSN